MDSVYIAKLWTNLAKWRWKLALRLRRLDLVSACKPSNSSGHQHESCRLFPVLSLWDAIRNDIWVHKIVPFQPIIDTGAVTCAGEISKRSNSNRKSNSSARSLSAFCGTGVFGARFAPPIMSFLHAVAPCASLLFSLPASCLLSPPALFLPLSRQMPAHATSLAAALSFLATSPQTARPLSHPRPNQGHRGCRSRVC